MDPVFCIIQRKKKRKREDKLDKRKKNVKDGRAGKKS